MQGRRYEHECRSRRCAFAKQTRTLTLQRNVRVRLRRKRTYELGRNGQAYRHEPVRGKIRLSQRRQARKGKRIALAEAQRTQRKADRGDCSIHASACFAPWREPCPSAHACSRRPTRERDVLAGTPSSVLPAFSAPLREPVFSFVFIFARLAPLRELMNGTRKPAKSRLSGDAVGGTPLRPPRRPCRGRSGRRPSGCGWPRSSRPPAGRRGCACRRSDAWRRRGSCPRRTSGCRRPAR